MAPAGGGTSSCTPATIHKKEEDQQRHNEDNGVAGGSFVAWIRRRTDTLICDVDAKARSEAGDYDKVRLLVELQGWRSYLLETSQKLAIRIPSREEAASLCRRESEILLELTDHVNRLQLLEDTIVLGGSRRALVDFTVAQIYKDIAEELGQQVDPNDDVEAEEPGRCGGLVQDTTAPFRMPAAGSRVTPFNVETFDLKDAVSAMSDVPMARMKMQAETEDEVFVLWEPGDKPAAPPPRSRSIRAHVVTARTKGHEADTRGRVDCQFFSPPIDFDLEEESPLQPGRHTDAVAPSLGQCSANVLSIKVARSSAVGFPLSLYGSVVVRDSLSEEGICLFQRDRDDPQLITSQDESLLLTGPSRGLVAFDYLDFDIDLKLKKCHVEDDVDFSQGTIVHYCIGCGSPLMSDELESPLSTVQLNYAPVRRALESTVQIQILKDSTQNGGKYMDRSVDGLYGSISARSSSISEEMMLFDSDASGAAITVGDDGVVELSRRVIAIHVRDSLVVTVETWGGGDGDDSREAAMKTSFTFTPLLCGEGRAVVPCVGYTMQMRVFWSALYIPFIDP